MPALIPAAVLSCPVQDLVHVRYSVIFYYISVVQSQTLSADQLPQCPRQTVSSGHGLRVVEVPGVRDEQVCLVRVIFDREV